jgi:hypothetical protein
MTHVYQDNGAYIVNLVVRDDDFAFDMDILNVTLNNSPPIINPVPLQIIQEDTPFNLNINASDVSGDTITFSDNSSMFDIDPVTGAIFFTPRNEDVGVHLINVSAIDDDGGESFIEFLITVENTNDPPHIVSSPITEAAEETLYQYDVVVEDDDTLVSDEVFTYFLDSAPSGMEINSSGRITWTPTNTQASQTFEVTLRVTDGEDYDIQNFNITVNNINDAPVITSAPVTYADEDVQYTYDVDAIDVDMGDFLTYKLDLAPQGMSIDETSGLISWLPTNEFVGNNEVMIKVTDSVGAFDTQEFSIWVSNVNDAPELEFIGELIATEDQPFYHQVNVTDVDSGDTLSFYDDSELFDIDLNTGVISFTPSNTDVGTYTVKITVSDYEGLTDYESITFRVLNVNAPPAIDEDDVLILSDAVSLSVGEIFTYQINAFDEDTEDTLIFSDDTDLFDIDPTTGEIAFTPEKKDVGMHIVEITVTDEDGDSDNLIVTFEVVGEEEEEGIDLIWLWLVLVSVMAIIIIIVFVFWKGKKVKPSEEPIVVEVFEEGVVREIEWQKQNFPPPPPPPPPPP